VTFRVPPDGIEYHTLKDHNDRPNPTALLEAFIASGHGEREFTRLVRELGGLVYSSALRRTQNAQLAEEVMQNVFALLARKAKSLCGHPSLAAWLHETTRLEASSVMRAEKRSQRKTAALAEELKTHCPMTNHQADSQANWKDALPLLDEALDRLSTAERQAILDRFYEGRQFKDIAARNGQSEAAVKMRITRALTKLSGMLTARGVTLSATVIASALGTELARSAPLQVATLVAPKALAAASSISTTTLLTNTLLTMSSTKTTTLTVAAVIAIATIPFARQRMEARNLQEQLARYDSPADLPFSNSREAGTESRPSGSASSNRRATAARPASTPRTILLDLCSYDPVASEAARDRVAFMSDEERAALLEELWRFPCTNGARNVLVNFLMQSNSGNPPDKMLDVLIAAGQYQAYATALVPADNPLTQWAEKDPASAVQWFERKLANGEFFGGLSDGQYQTVYLHLMPGVIAADPPRALELYSRSPEDIRNAESGMYWPLHQLAGSLAKEMVGSGKAENINKLLNLTEGKNREVVVYGVADAFRHAGRQAEAEAFAERHLPKR
jgi:RNA polymerase sigma factor (sigma-70 family)